MSAVVRTRLLKIVAVRFEFNGAVLHRYDIGALAPLSEEAAA
jgi:hypothetical protein